MNTMLPMARRLSLMVAFLAIGCELPRDPEGTLPRIRGGVLHVGVIHNPPWVRVQGDEISGVEVELIQSLARELDAEVRWVPGREGELLEALEKFELDIIVGGLEKSTPWKSKLAWSMPYLKTEVIVGSPVDQLPVKDLSGQKVAVRQGDVLLGALVREHDGTPVEVSDPPSSGLPVAAEDWQIEAWGLKRGEVNLLKHEHVLAAPPGENGWLLEIDRFVYRHKSAVPALLVKEMKR